MSNSVYEGNVLGGYDDIDQSVVQSDTYSETEAPIDGEAVLTGLANITSAAGTRLVIGIDYGTTYTGVAYAIVPQGVAPANLKEIKVIQNWGRDMNNTQKVPSRISYSPAREGEKQWGKDMSTDAIVILHTKLELDEQPDKEDELDSLLYTLEGMKNLNFEDIQKAGPNPAFPVQNPEDIVTDYMAKVYERVNLTLDFLKNLRDTIPVDIVFSLPLEWSYVAKNATYRAIAQGGFNRDNFKNLQDIILIKEPIAAALYTARYYKEKKVEILKDKECFVVCDAGGGTVDLVSFRVVQLEPVLEVKQVGNGASAKCGSAFVDWDFKAWLRDEVLKNTSVNVSTKDANQKVTTQKVPAFSVLHQGKLSISGSETVKMREVMQKFISLKESFSGQEQGMLIPLPAPLDRLNVPGFISDGDLNLTCDDMMNIFDVTVNKIVECILQQMFQIKKERKKLRNVFMVGGYGSSKYLQLRVSEALKKYEQVKVHHPADTSWSAVVQGAVIHGIEKDLWKDCIFTQACPMNYGIAVNEFFSPTFKEDVELVEEQITNHKTPNQPLQWLIKRGDLVLPSETNENVGTATFPFFDDSPRVFSIPVYSYSPGSEGEDWLPTDAEEYEHELDRITDLQVNLSGIDILEFPQYSHHGKDYRIATLKVKMRLQDGLLEIEVFWKVKKVCTFKQ